jgi:hypothetical protein
LGSTGFSAFIDAKACRYSRSAKKAPRGCVQRPQQADDAIGPGLFRVRVYTHVRANTTVYVVFEQAPSKATAAVPAVAEDAPSASAAEAEDTTAVAFH